VEEGSGAARPVENSQYILLFRKTRADAIAQWGGDSYGRSPRLSHGVCAMHYGGIRVSASNEVLGISRKGWMRWV